MAGCDKKIWYPANHAGASRAREGAGDRKAREKIAMRFVCSVNFASRSISMFFIFMHVLNV